MPITLLCAVCNTPFTVKRYRLRDNPRFCSPICMGIAKRIPEQTRLCASCGMPFVLGPTQIHQDQQHCSCGCHLRVQAKLRSQRALEAFWTRVQHCDHEWLCFYCCWPWAMSVSRFGYGKVNFEGKTGPSHVLAWRLWHGCAVPAGMKVGHYCENRLCCNPMHLFLGTTKAIAAYTKQQGHLPMGSTHGRSKLIEEDIPVIFAMHHSGLSAPAIAKTYGSVSSAILAVLHRKAWGHVSIDEALATLRPKPTPIRSLPVEERRAYWRAWYYEHQEACLLGARNYRATHLEEVRAQDRIHKKEWGDANKDIVHQRNIAYYANNTEKVRVANAAYQRNNPEKVQAFQERRRARKAAVLNDFTTEQWEEILLVFQGRCAYCGKKSKRLEIEHITPLSKGGPNTVSNIVPACRRCNAKKHAGPVPLPVQPLLFTLAEAKPLKTSNSY